MKINFTDKHIVVTGGTGALGSAVTGALLNNHAFVSIPCFNEAELNDFKYKNHKSIFIQTGIDLADEDSSHDFYKRAVRQHGALWGSVHAAGGFAMSKIKNTSKADFIRQINLNLVTCFNSCKNAISLMKKNSGGRIVNIASRPGLNPEQGDGMTPYTVSKAGVTALTQSLAAEVISSDILINAVAPSVIDTPQNREAMPAANFSKWPKPKEIANQILYLISEKNSLTSGAVIPVYGKS